MKEYHKLFTVLFLLTGIYQYSISQITIEGYTFEQGNRGYLNEVKIELVDLFSQKVVAQTFSNVDGKFELVTSLIGDYMIRANKDLFHEFSTDVSTKNASNDKKIFLKIEMKRAPGYIFEITLAKKKMQDSLPVDAVRGALIEVYNNSTKKEVLILKNHPEPYFKVNMSKGNHYTILIRKVGYLAKRMEAFVDVEGCILCFEGVGEVQPGVSDNLTEGNEMGTLLANVEMEEVFEGKEIDLQNIYYDFSDWKIRADAAEELDKVAIFLNDNPELTVELGSHTDSRGDSGQNLQLSQKRAKAAVDYLVINKSVARARIFSNGYGENYISNKCVNGVKCTEEEHELNRRTQLKILGISEQSAMKSLVQIKKEEDLEKLILDLQNGEQIKASDNDELSSKLEKLGESADKEEAKNDKLDAKMENAEEVLEQSVSKVSDEISIVETELKNEKELIEEVEISMDSKVTKKNALEFSTENIQNLEYELNKEELAFKNFTGYKIVLQKSKEALTKDNSVMQSYGEILGVYKTADEELLYTIGNFQNEEKAEVFLKTQLLTKYPEAFLIHFENGKRLQY